MRQPRIQIFIIIGLVLAFNPLSLSLWLKWDWLGKHFEPGKYHHSLLAALLWILDGWGLLTISWMSLWKMNLRNLFNHSAAFVFLSWFAGLIAMLTINPMYAGKFQLLRLLMPLGLLVLLMRSFYLLVVKQPDGKQVPIFRGAATALFGIFSIVLLFEGAFMFVARSSSNNTSLASRVWFNLHWKLNSSGFRDAEWNFESSKGKKKLLLIGDSFVAGHGIIDPQKRFGDLLQKKLGNSWQVYNLGLNGADTQTEDSVLNIFPKTNKDFVLVCWFVNDIEERALAAGLGADNSNRYISPVSIVYGSYLFNFLYLLNPDPKAGKDYLKFLKDAYADSSVLNQHLSDLIHLSKRAKTRNANFAVVLFPMMQLIKESEFALVPVKNHLQNFGIPFVDLSPVFSKFNTEQLIVNSSDSHPNEFANEIAFEEIWKFLLIEFAKADSLRDYVVPSQ